VKNFQFEVTSSAMRPKDGVSKFMAISEQYIQPFSPVLKYLLVFIILFIGYKKIIVPFAERMLEFSKEEEELERPRLEIEDEDEEDLVEKVQQMRKKVEDQLGMEGLNEDELKYEVLIEKVKREVEERPEEIALLLQALIQEETEGSEVTGGER
jgi:flagellar M-ring protein FliF